MEEMLNDTVPDEELKKFEKIYFDLLGKKNASKKAQFEYAWCLVRSKYPVDIKKGIILLGDLYDQDIEGRRDILYQLAFGHAKMKEYSKALEYCRAHLEIEPTNMQVQELEAVIKTKLNKEGKIGIAITAAGVLMVGGLAVLCVALTKAKRK